MAGEKKGRFRKRPLHQAKFFVEIGGAEGIRTLDLLDAIEARSQLRHGPTDVNLRPPGFTGTLPNCITAPPENDIKSLTLGRGGRPEKRWSSAEEGEERRLRP